MALVCSFGDHEITTEETSDRMTSDVIPPDSETIEALEQVLRTTQRELDRLRAGSLAAAAVQMPETQAEPTDGQPTQADPTRLPPPPRPTDVPVVPVPEGRPVVVSTPPISVEWLFRVGGISLVVLAAIFFVSTAISRDWIGPEAQLALATVTSVGFIIQSFRFGPSKSQWRTTFAAGGAAGFFVSGVVGHIGLDILSLQGALGWLATAVVGFLALSKVHRSEVLAGLGAPATVAGAFLLSLSGNDTPAMLVSTGALWAIALGITTFGERWYGARSLGAAVAAGLIALGVIASVIAGPTLTVTLVATLLGIVAVVWLAVQHAGMFPPGDTGGVSRRVLGLIEAWTFAILIPWIAFIVELLVPNGATVGGFEIEGWAVIATGIAGAAIVTALASKADSLVILLQQLGALGTVGVGLAIVFNGPVLLVSLLAMTVTSVALAQRTRAPEAILAAAGLGSIVIGWTSILVLIALSGAGLTIAETIATGLVFVSAGLGVWLGRDREEVVAIGLLVWIGLLSWIAAAWVGVPQAQMWISISWAVASVALLSTRMILTGEKGSELYGRVVNLGLATLGVTGAKLIFVDLVAVDVLWRAALFFVIGGMFLRLAFILPKLLNPVTPKTLSEAG